MVVRNGVESKRMTSGDFDLTSVSSSRVLLPCRPWGEMRLEMMNAASLPRPFRMQRRGSLRTLSALAAILIAPSAAANDS